MVELKIVRIRNSLGVRLPREVPNRMRVANGDKLALAETPEGRTKTTASDSS